ncbi:DUF1385 domain-containing protein [Oscillospiraceae bacterium Marseille-Q3528]|nr:DUF1385 domain-containing protein [Oscillospiraceae bacterium Marseille-Q3528]
MRNSGIGGQAVIEGIMMRNQDRDSIGVRKPDKSIEGKVEGYKSFIPCKTLTKIPFIRGVFNFIDSMVIGMKTLTYSASFYEDEEDAGKPKNEKSEALMMGGTVALSIVLAIGIFMLLPYFAASLFRRLTDSALVISVLEGVLRLVIFLGYIALISRMEDIQRVFQYHGAEHKCINCIEHGMELNVENVQKSSRLHRRCGTSFLLIVMVVSIIFFLFIRVNSPLLRVVVRILLVPVIAGVSYEFIRLAGKSENPVVLTLSKPGLWLQKLTTREPEDDMVEVAIAAVEAVFDWRKFLAGADGADCKVAGTPAAENAYE